MSAGGDTGIRERGRPELIQPPGWKRPSGYSNGAAATGRVLCVAGQIGWDPATGRFESDLLAEQARRALENVAAVLRAGGAEPAHVVRLTWYVTDRAAYQAARRELGAAYRELFGAHYPAMSVVFVSGLVEERALVEIEATAVVPA
ncbi:MAG TPA: RidA family protein [Gemmatimonadaceae bacterium]|nr:RidA family protein [Gemmatimonadaceae bacterium]